MQCTTFGRRPTKTCYLGSCTDLRHLVQTVLTSAINAVRRRLLCVRGNMAGNKRPLPLFAGSHQKSVGMEVSIQLRR
jgi:hypothetical protein